MVPVKVVATGAPCDSSSSVRTSVQTNSRPRRKNIQTGLVEGYRLGTASPRAEPTLEDRDCTSRAQSGRNSAATSSQSRSLRMGDHLQPVVPFEGAFHLPVGQYIPVSTSYRPGKPSGPERAAVRRALSPAVSKSLPTRSGRPRTPFGWGHVSC